MESYGQYIQYFMGIINDTSAQARNYGVEREVSPAFSQKFERSVKIVTIYC